MEFSEADKGRVFLLRLHDGEILHEEIENFAKTHGISHACVNVVGGIDSGSILIVGPEDGRVDEIVPMRHVVENICEVTGSGTIVPDESMNPVLHMHIAAGRKNQTITGCVRQGVKVWLVMEVIIQEFSNCLAMRIVDNDSGFKLLVPNPQS